MTRNFTTWPIIVVLTVLSLPLIIMYTHLVIGTVSSTPAGSMLPDHFTLDYWRFLIDPTVAGNIWIATWHSFIVASSMVVFVLLFSATAGYAFSRLNMPFRSYLLGGLMVLHTFPAVTLLVGLFMVLKYAGLYDTGFGFILVKTSLMLPFGIWITKGFYDTVPWEIEMAGLQDGASRFTVWRRLVLPQVVPGLIALAVFTFLDGWGEYLLATVFVPSGNFMVLSVYLNQIMDPGSASYDFNLSKAIGLFYMMPVLFLFAISQNKMVNIFKGGTKG